MVVTMFSSPQAGLSCCIINPSCNARHRHQNPNELVNYAVRILTFTCISLDISGRCHGGQVDQIGVPTSLLQLHNTFKVASGKGSGRSCITQISGARRII